MEQNYVCTNEQFYLAVPEVANYLVQPQQNLIIIEKAHSNTPYPLIATWLFGTVFAYLLQYHGFLVLHGSAVVINKRAVIFSGESGAGKSTLAANLVKRGYTLVTDDVVVVTTLADGGFGLIPGPAKLKLWQDALNGLNYTSTDGEQILNKANKYQFSIACHTQDIYAISHFFELNLSADITQLSCSEISGINKLTALINNTYRYSMLKPLGKIQTHFKQCGLLASYIDAFAVTRPQLTTGSADLADLVLMQLSDLYQCRQKGLVN